MSRQGGVTTRSRLLARVLGTMLLGIVVALGSWLPAAAAAPTDAPVVELFWAEGCPYCAEEKQWLASLQNEVAGLVVVDFEVSGSAANRALLATRAEEHGIEVQAVPVTFVAERHWIGFNEVIAAEIRAAVVSPGTGDDAPAAEESAVVDVPVLGPVDLGDSSLVAATLLIGALDGVNPCSLWVLSLLLALVLHTGSRRRVFAIGLTFLVVTAGMYALYVGGLYGALSYVAHQGWIRVTLAAVAGVFGLVAVKDFFWFGHGPSMSIPEHRKPAIYRRMRRLAAGDRRLAPVLGGTALMAVGVSLVETPCTAGFPIVWANLLASQGVAGAGAAALFALYMLVFLLDEVAVFAMAVVTMRMAKLQEHHGRLLKLVAGVVMLSLATTMLVAPELLEDLTGTLLVFGSAGLVVTLVAVIHGRRRAVPLEATGSDG